MQSSRVIAFLILFLGFHCIQASGQQVVATWTDASGNWSNPANWSTLTVPNNGGGKTYSVTISAPSSTVSMDVHNAVIDNLTLGTATSLGINPGGSLSLASGASSNSGVISVFSTAALINNSGARFTNNGSVGGSPFSALGNDGTFINNGSILVNIDDSFTNAAGAHFANFGTTIVDSSILRNGGTFNNNGTFKVSSESDPGNLDNSGTFNNRGTMNLQLDFNSSGFSNSGKFNNSGTMNALLGCGACGTPVSISNSGTINNRGTLNVIGETGIANSPGFFTNSSTLNNSGTISNSAIFTNSGATTISSTGLFTTSKNYTQTAGRTSVDGTLTATSGAIVDIQGGTLGGKGTINGNVLMAGTMMPGDAPGTLTIFGNYEQTGTGMFKELMSPFAQAFLDTSGNVVLDPGATLDIRLLGGFNPLGDTISIMDFSTLFGQFANGSSFLDDGFLWDITYRQHEIDVTAVEAVPEPSSMLLLSLGFIALGTIVKRKKWQNS